jgi:hypothetical protein
MVVALLDFEDRVLTQLRTFSKAFAASDGACLSSGSLPSSRFTMTDDAYPPPRHLMNKLSLCETKLRYKGGNY